MALALATSAVAVVDPLWEGMGVRREGVCLYCGTLAILLLLRCICPLLLLMFDFCDLFLRWADSFQKRGRKWFCIVLKHINLDA